MIGEWPKIALGTLLRRADETALLDQDARYKELTVRLWGKGVVLRRIVIGADVGLTRRYVARNGQFVLSRIDARNGALGLVPAELDGAVVTNDFPLFTLNQSLLFPPFLGWMVRTAAFVEMCQRASEGTTNRVRLQEDAFLALEIALPSVTEQQRIVARIDELAARIHEANALSQFAAAEAETLIHATVSAIDRRLRARVPLTTLERFAAKERGSLRSGPFGSALLHSEFVNEGIPAVGIQDVQENSFVLTRRWNVTSNKADELNRYTIKPGDILVTVMGTLGRVCVVPEDIPRMISTKHVWTVTLDHTIADARWISYWINFSRTVRDELIGRGTGTAISGLNGAKIRSLSLPDIPLSQQRQIVSELGALQEQYDSLKRHQAESAAKLDALLPAILNRAFRGEL
jgi:type I restriction enzyme S subunit